MSVQDIVNSGGYDFGNTAAMASQFNAEEKDFSGLNTWNANDTSETFYNPQDPTTLKAKAEIERAKNNGVPFTPPSNGRMLFDMLGSLLISYGAMKLLGADGNEALGVGLVASATAHDKDKQEIDRYGILQGAIKQNGNIYSPEILWNFMKTGDGKAMEEVEREHYQSGDKQAAWNHEDASREDTQQFNKEQQGRMFNNQNNMQRERLNEQEVMQQERLKAQAVNGKNALTASRLGTLDNQIVDNDKPMKDRYEQQIMGWQDAFKQLQIIDNAQAVLDNPNSSKRDRDRATSEIQGAIPSLTSAVARGERGGNATLTNEEVKHALPSLGLAGDKFNAATGVYNGTISPSMIDAISNQIKGNYNSVSSSLENLNMRERQAMDMAANGDMTGAFSNTLGTIPALENNAAPVGNVKQVTYSDSQLKSAAGQSVGAGVPEGAEITNGSITLKAKNGVWVLA